MTPRISSILFIAAIVLSRSTLAQDSSCPQNLSWRDASFAQRLTNEEGQTLKATIEGFSNLSIAQIDAGAYRGKVMSLRGRPGDDAIAFTFGEARLAPQEFAEISIAVEPPMVNGTWPRMRKPCDIKDGSVIEFDENDMADNAGEKTANQAKLRGVIRRQGLRFTYTVTIDATGGQTPAVWQGELNYEPPQPFDMTTDVQGWHVFRGGRFVRAIPLGKPVQVATVLNEMRK